MIGGCIHGLDQSSRLGRAEIHALQSPEALFGNLGVLPDFDINVGDSLESFDGEISERLWVEVNSRHVNEMLSPVHTTRHQRTKAHAFGGAGR